MGKMFPNRAGLPVEENDKVLEAELTAAGIPWSMNIPDGNTKHLQELFLKNSGEVKTHGVGWLLNGRWQFRRLWCYWAAEGEGGLPIEVAEKLHETYGKEVRVAGHCGCPHPREWFRGFGVDHYHVDTPEGLKALADAIKAVYEANEAKLVELRAAGKCMDNEPKEKGRG